MRLATETGSVVSNATERDLLFPASTRALHQRVFHLDDKKVRRWDGTNWVVDPTDYADIANAPGVDASFGNNTITTTGLTYGYNAGTAIVAGVVTRIATGTVGLTDNADNYIERTYAGVVSVNTSGFSASKIPMAKVTTLAGVILTSVDYRSAISPTQPFPLQAGEASVVDVSYPVGDVRRYYTNNVKTAIIAAIAALPSTGGVVDLRGMTGAQTLTGQVPISKANVTLQFGPSTFTLSGVVAQQTPTFGANFLISVANVWLISAGQNTKFVHAAASESVMVTFLHGTATLGGVLGIEMDGNKANNTSIVADSFQSGVSIISDSSSGVTADARITIEGCRIHDFNHYGIQTYGNHSGGNWFRLNRIYSNGKSDANGTGDGIYLNLGSSFNTVEGNFCYSNRRSGIRSTAVGVTTFANKIRGNFCYSNTEDGIRCDEQLNFGSTSGTGQFGLQITNNHCYSNTGSGIFLFTADNVGIIANPNVQGNHCYSNTGWGIRLSSNSHATNNTRQGTISGNQCYLNTQDGVALSSGCLDHMVVGNTLLSNTGVPILDNGTRTVSHGNNKNITDKVAYFDDGITAADVITAAHFQVNAGEYRASEGGVRSWTAKASGGNWNLNSGDAAGAVKSNTAFDGLEYRVGGVKVLGLQDTGWANQTAAASKANLGPTPTVAQIAGWCSAIDVLLKQNGITHT